MYPKVHANSEKPKNPFSQALTQHTNHQPQNPEIKPKRKPLSDL